MDLKKDADENQIRKAYKKLATKWHPDRNSESEEQKEQAEKKFKEINEAYEVLKDPKKKQMFDSGVDPNDQEASAGHGFGGGQDMGDVFSMFFGGGGGGGHSHFAQEDFGGFGGFGGGDPFSSSKGGKKKGSRQTFNIRFG